MQMRRRELEVTEETDGLIGPGRVSVVTGAASGIGRAMAELFASEGSSVLVADLDMNAAEAVSERIRQKGGSAEPFAVDVSDASSVDALASATRDRFGGRGGGSLDTRDTLSGMCGTARARRAF